MSVCQVGAQRAPSCPVHFFLLLGLWSTNKSYGYLTTFMLYFSKIIFNFQKKKSMKIIFKLNYCTMSPSTNIVGIPCIVLVLYKTQYYKQLDTKHL